MKRLAIPLSIAAVALLAAGARVLDPGHRARETGATALATPREAPPQASGEVEGRLANRPGASPRAAKAPSPPATATRATPRPATEEQAVSPNPAAAGMMVAIDPETGELGAPSPEQIRELTAGSTLTRSDEGLVQIHRADGSICMILDERFRDYAMIQMGSDGRPVFGCRHGSGPHLHARGDSLPPPALEEE